MKRAIRSIAFALTLASAAALGACAQTSTTESTGKYVDSAAITSKVKAAILQDSALKVMQVQVTTYNNVVQLSGFVDSPQMIQRAGVVAANVSGVASVQNDLIVK
jgi:osmotically-inducible protein OsmY